MIDEYQLIPPAHRRFLSLDVFRSGGVGIVLRPDFKKKGTLLFHSSFPIKRNPLVNYSEFWGTLFGLLLTKAPLVIFVDNYDFQVVILTTCHSKYSGMGYARKYPVVFL